MIFEKDNKSLKADAKIFTNTISTKVSLQTPMNHHCFSQSTSFDAEFVIRKTTSTKIIAKLS